MAAYRLASAGDDIKLWDCNGFSLLKQFNTHSHNVSSISWSHDNNLIASTSSAGDKIVLTYLETAGYSNEIAVDEGCTCIAFNSTSRFLVAGATTTSIASDATSGTTSDHVVHIWDMKTRRLKQTYTGHTAPVTCVAFSAGDSTLASASQSGHIRLYNVVTGVASNPLVIQQAVQQVQYSHFRRSLLASASDSGAVCLWDVNKRALSHAFSSTHKAPATGIAFSPSNDMLLMSVGLDKRIICYDVQGKTAVQTLIAESPLTSIALMHDGTTLAVGSTRGKVYVYDLRNSSEPNRVIVAHKSSVQCLQFQHIVKSAKGSNTSAKSRSVSISSSGKSSKQSSSETRRSSENSIGSSTANHAYSAASSSSDERFTPSVPSSCQLASGDLNVHSPLRETAALVSAASSSGHSAALVSGQPSVRKSNSELTHHHHHHHHRLRPQSPIDNYVDGIFSPLGGVNATLKTENDRWASPSLRPNPAAQPIGDPAAMTNSIVRSVSHNQMSSGPSLASPRLSASLTNGINNTDNTDLHAATATTKPTSLGPTTTWPPLTVPATHVVSTEMNGPLPSPDSAVCSPVQAPASVTAAVPALTVVEGAEGDAAAMAAPMAFQAEFIRRIVEDLLEDTRDQLHRDVLNLQMSMLKQFQAQQVELSAMLQQHCLRELQEENERLREENRRLKKKF